MIRFLLGADRRRNCTLPFLVSITLLATLLAAPLVHAQRGESVAELEARLADAQKAGSTRLEQAVLEHRLGRAYVRAGRPDDAVRSFESALAVREAALPADSPEIADTLTGLAVARNSQGRKEETEQLFLRALEVRKKSLGKDAPDVGASYGNLGALYVQQQRWEEAGRNYDQAIEIYEKHGRRGAGMVVALAQRATVYEKLGDLKKADELYERIVEEEASAAGASSGRVAVAHTTLASRYRERGDVKSAEEHYRRALEMLGSAETPSAPTVAVNLEGMGWAAYQNGKLEEAELHYRRAYGVGESVLGRDHPLMIPILEGYAGVLTDLGRGEEAARLSDRAARLRQVEDAREAAPPPAPAPAPAPAPPVSGSP